jgi:competence protein ComEC
MEASVKRAPLLIPAIAFVTGILSELHGLSLIALLAAGALIFVRHDACVALACGVAVGTLHGHPFTVDHELRTARYEGTVTGDVRREDMLSTFPFAIDGFVTVRATSREMVHAGDRLIVRGSLRPVDEPRNPGEPSARDIALDDGIAGELFVQRIMTRREPDFRDFRVWAPVARAGAASIVRASMPEPEASILAGALWGERGAIPSAIRDDFQATGTVHVLVTAGLHIGVIAGILASLFGLLGLPRAASSLSIIPFVYAYAWTSGWHLPSQRAAAMIAIALIARAAGARSISLNTLSAAAIVVAMAWPVSVGSISFALSFSCVTAIVLFAPAITERLASLHIHERIAEALALTAATQIGVWPLTAATFFTLAPYAVIANAIVVPLVGVTMIAGTAAIALHPIPMAAAIAVRWDMWLVTIILAVTHAVASLPGARLMVTPPPMWSIVLYDIAAIVAACIFRQHLRLALALIATASVFVLCVPLIRPPGPLTITMLDVGQGDGIVIRTPRGHTILIDTGGRLERGPSIDGQSPAERSADRIVLPYLRRAGITDIDLMILTHPHGDHVGGFAGIVRSLQVDQIFDSGQQYGGRAFNDGMREAAIHRVPVHIARCGDRWSSDDGVNLSVISPCGALISEGKNDVNENSVVAMLRYGAFRMLFTGDAGFQTERRLLREGVDLRADFLKVGHHGSAYASSSAFLAAVRPRIAFISVGRHNVFGHPATTTIDGLATVAAIIYRTDQCGAITLKVTATRKVDTMVHCIAVTR